MASKKDGSGDSLHERLSEKFRLEDIEWIIVNAYDYTNRSGHQIRAFAKPYIKKESAERRADRVLGPQNWRNNYSMPDQAGRFKYMLEFRASLESEWIPRWEGGSIDNNAKGGFAADAFEIALTYAEKRAWAKIGIGRYLKLVPQIEVQLSSNWQEGWNRYTFDSRVSEGKTMRVWWTPPQLPEWALHREDEYEEKPEGGGGEQDPPDQEELAPASEAQQEMIDTYWLHMPEDEREKWYSVMFKEEVDEDTGEVTRTRRKKLSKKYASKIISSLQKGYGELGEDGVPEAFLTDDNGPRPDEDPPKQGEAESPRTESN